MISKRNRLNLAALFCLVLLMVPNQITWFLGVVMYGCRIWMGSRDEGQNEMLRLKKSAGIIVFTALTLLETYWAFYWIGMGQAAVAVLLLVLVQILIGLSFLFRPYISLPIVLGWLVAIVVGSTGIVESLH